MKKIVFVIESLHLGGAEKSLTTLLQNLDGTKYDIDLILFKEGGIFINQVPPYVNIIIKNFSTFSLYDKIRFNFHRQLQKLNYHNAQIIWPFLKANIAAIEKEYDIAIAYSQGFATYYVSELICASTKYAWINIDYVEAGYKIEFDYPFYKNFNKVIAVSLEVKNIFSEELLKINKEIPIEVVKDITDKAVVTALAENNSNILFSKDFVNIVSVGRLAKQKGFHLAVSSCNILLKKGYKIKWHIIGEGCERKRILKLVKKYKLETTFLLLGEKKNPYPYMKNCDIYVQTSLFEGLGLTVIEASYLNKPIVSTCYKTVYAVITDEETGLIADMNPENIASMIERLIINEALRNKFTTNLAKLENNDMQETLLKITKLLESR